MTLSKAARQARDRAGGAQRHGWPVPEIAARRTTFLVEAVLSDLDQRAAMKGPLAPMSAADADRLRTRLEAVIATTRGDA